MLQNEGTWRNTVEGTSKGLATVGHDDVGDVSLSATANAERDNDTCDENPHKIFHIPDIYAAGLLT